MSQRNKRRQAEEDVIHEIFLNGMSLMFEAFIKGVPEEEKRLWREDFEECQEAIVALYQEKGGAFVWKDVVERLPENLWVIALDEYHKTRIHPSPKPSSAVQERISREFQADVERKLKGTDRH